MLPRRWAKTVLADPDPLNRRTSLRVVDHVENGSRRVDQLLARVLEIHGHPVADHGLDLSGSPIGFGPETDALTRP